MNSNPSQNNELINEMLDSEGEIIDGFFKTKCNRFDLYLRENSFRRFDAHQIIEETFFFCIFN